MEDSVLYRFKSGFLLPPGILEAVQICSGWADGKGVWLSFEAETQTTCDVKEVISGTFWNIRVQMRSSKMQIAKAILLNLVY